MESERTTRESWLQAKSLWIVIGIVLIASVTTMSRVLVWWDSPTTESATSDSVDALIESLPCLQELGVTSCKYTITVSTKRGLVPAPSDSETTIVGTIQIPTHFQYNAEDWVPIAREQIPHELQRTTPDGVSLRYSATLSAAFESNPYFWYGHVVRSADGDCGALYFIAKDADHRIKLP